MLPTSPIMSTSGLSASAAPASPPPGSMASTPGGSRSPISSAQRSADSGACAGGLMMTALPAASGAASLPMANSSGWLNATMRATTPSGSRSV